VFTQLRIQNFKSWADTGEFRMAPLTGFFGTNSSGKTAILQFLLMLKQTVESSDRQRILHLGGDQYSYVDLGTIYDIIHRHQLPEKIEFSFSWKPIPIKDGTVVFSGLTIFSESDQDASSFYDENVLILPPLNFESEIGFDVDKIVVNFLKYSYNTKDGQEIFCGIKALEIENGDSDYQFFSWIDNPDKSHSFKLFKNYGLKYIPEPGELNISDPNGSIYSRSYENLFQNTYYLGPLRDYPKRIYLWSGEQPQNVGNIGELAIPALLASRKKNPEVEISVAKALKELGLIDSFRLNAISVDRGYSEVLVKKSTNSAEVLITDVGFGVSQVLPILVLCYYIPKGATLILEQPEIHLHPSVQAGLADVFIDVIKTRNLQIIIESHSEHLLRRLQRRIAEEKDGFTNKDTALYFCKMDEQGDSELVPLEIDPYGNICNYPDDFFGDEMGDIFAMNKAAIKRQMNTGS